MLKELAIIGTLFALPLTSHAQVSSSDCQTMSVSGEGVPGETARYGISQPGVYCLTQNIYFGGSSEGTTTPAIDITATGDVTLDLNGFSIVGPLSPSYSPPPETIRTAGIHGIGIRGARNVTIRNGTIDGAKIGIYLGLNGGLTYNENIVVEDLRIMNTGTYGIDTHSSVGKPCVNCTFKNNHISGASTAGIRLRGSQDAQFLNNTLSDNDWGIYVHDGRHTVVQGNHFSGTLVDEVPTGNGLTIAGDTSGNFSHIVTDNTFSNLYVGMMLWPNTVVANSIGSNVTIPFWRSNGGSNPTEKGENLF